jgi:hypothetical protein
LKGGFLMVNQKGQAFSVFELMIAGVVAFAILMVLMQVIGGILTDQDTNALDALSNSVKSANPSGEERVTNFVLRKGATIDNVDLAMSTDLDEASFVFYTNDDLPEVESDDGTYIRYTGSQQKLILSAIIICKPTGTQLDTAIQRLQNEYSINTAFTPVGNSDDSGLCEAGLVCCGIVPLKRN